MNVTFKLYLHSSFCQLQNVYYNFPLSFFLSIDKERFIILHDFKLLIIHVLENFSIIEKEYIDDIKLQQNYR